MEEKVIWSRKAESSLERIYKFIAEDSEVYGHPFVKSLILYVEDYFSKAANPGRIVPEFQNSPLAFLREIIFGDTGLFMIHLRQMEKITLFWSLVADRTLKDNCRVMGRIIKQEVKRDFSRFSPFF